MKTKAISSIFVLFAIAVGMASTAPAAFAAVEIGAVEESGFSQTCAVSQGGDGCYTPVTATVDVGDRKSTRLNSSHSQQSRMPSSA